MLRICQLPSPTLRFKQDKQVMTLKFQNLGGGVGGVPCTGEVNEGAFQAPGEGEGMLSGLKCRRNFSKFGAGSE